MNSMGTWGDENLLTNFFTFFAKTHSTYPFIALLSI